MKHKNLILLLLISLVALAFAKKPYYLVKYVYDGDTILIETGQKVRYVGINAPEIDPEGANGEYMAYASRALHSRLVENNRVRLEFDREKRVRHGRLLAYVYLEKGEMVNTDFLMTALL